MVRKHAVASIILAALIAQPCLAADDFRNLAGTERPSAFAGLNVRVPLDRSRRLNPTARLQLTSAYQVRDPRSGSVQNLRAPSLELGAGRGGKPVLFAAGQDISQMKTRLGMSKTVTIVVVAGGVLLGLALLAALSTPPQVDFED